MNTVEVPRIVLRSNIDEKSYDEISNLEKICMAQDKIVLKLELDFKLKNSSHSIIGKIPINEFMYYNKEKLIGYIGVSAFGGDELEVSGMVHPGYRNQGIFTQLYHLVQDEFKKRACQEMLLLCPKNSISGSNFIKKIAAEYHHSEYDMDLNPERFSRTVEYTLKIEETTENEMQFMGKLDNINIGSVRIELTESSGGIYGLEVLPQYRGQGYGRELLVFAVEKLISMGAKKIILQVDTDNENALNLYQSCGFVEGNVMNYYLIHK